MKLIDIIKNKDTTKALAVIDTYNDLAEKDNEGSTPLIIACENNMDEVAMKLINTGKSEPNHHNRFNETAIKFAAYNNMQDVVLALLNKYTYYDRREMRYIGIYANKYNMTKVKEYISSHADADKFKLVKSESELTLRTRMLEVPLSYYGFTFDNWLFGEGWYSVSSRKKHNKNAIIVKTPFNNWGMNRSDFVADTIPDYHILIDCSNPHKKYVELQTLGVPYYGVLSLEDLNKIKKSPNRIFDIKLTEKRINATRAIESVVSKKTKPKTTSEIIDVVENNYVKFIMENIYDWLYNINLYFEGEYTYPQNHLVRDKFCNESRYSGMHKLMLKYNQLQEIFKMYGVTSTKPLVIYWGTNVSDKGLLYEGIIQTYILAKSDYESSKSDTSFTQYVTDNGVKYYGNIYKLTIHPGVPFLPLSRTNMDGPPSSYEILLPYGLTLTRNNIEYIDGYKIINGDITLTPPDKYTSLFADEYKNIKPKCISYPILQMIPSNEYRAEIKATTKKYVNTKKSKTRKNKNVPK